MASGYIPFYNIFSMANKPGLQSIFILMIFSTNIIANAIFIPLIGYYGAAIGTAFSFLSSIFYFKFLSKYFLGLKLI
jgi:O-antigen/teichoic acid export membrane protein